MPRPARVTAEVAAVCANRYARRAGRRLAARLRPAFVYQRYDAFITCGIELAERHGIPVVLEWNNSEVWARVNWHADRRLKRLLYPFMVAAEDYAATHPTLLAAVSEQAAHMALEAGADPERVLVSPNAVDLAAIDAARGEAPADGRAAARVGWVGSFGPWHGAEVLLEALAQLPREVGAVMVGDGAERAGCEALADRLGVRDRVEFTGALAHPEAVRRLAECDVLASPHVPLPGRAFFGSPTKLFEYMAMGQPIVASSLEQIGDVLEDGRTARLVAPGDAQDLARGIADVLDREDRGRALGDAARSEAEAKHTWERRARAILDRLAAPAARPGAADALPVEA